MGIFDTVPGGGGIYVNRYPTNTQTVMYICVFVGLKVYLIMCLVLAKLIELICLLFERRLEMFLVKDI